MITLYIQINIFYRNAKIANVAKKETLKFSVDEVDKLYERQRGRVVRAPDLKSGDPDHSDHWLDSFEVVRGSTPRRDRKRGTGNGEPETESERTKQGKARRNNLGKCNFLPAVPPDGQYVLISTGINKACNGA